MRPLAFILYYPQRPEAVGQIKGGIIAEIKIKNRKLVKNIRLKFDIDDAAGRRVDSKTWAIASQGSFLFSLFHPDTKFIVWDPDMLNAIKDIAKNRNKPFKLWIIVTWQGLDKKEHRLESYSELRYSEALRIYYFDERSNALVY